MTRLLGVGHAARCAAILQLHFLLAENLVVMRAVPLVALLASCGSDGRHLFEEVLDPGASFIAHAPDPDAWIAALGAGVAAADLDGDGLPELAVAGALNGFAIYRNAGELRFEDASTAFGIDGSIPAQAVAFADLDNDGDQDLVVAELEDSHVYENQGGGRLLDVSSRSVFQSDRVMRGIQVSDFDDDGLLDLLFLSAPNWDGLGTRRAANLLFRNGGGLHFEDVTERYGVGGDGATLAAASADYDLDGKRDLYLANDAFSANFGNGRIEARFAYPIDMLLKQNAPQVPSFSNLTEAAGIAYPRSSMGVVVADFDGDALPDFFITDFGENSLLVHEGAGVFSNRASEYGVGTTYSHEASCVGINLDPGPMRCLLVGWGAASLDADLDGWDDLIVVHGYEAAQETTELIGGEDGFTMIDDELPWMNGRTLVSADLDQDGDLDLVVGIFRGAPRIFENLADGSHWLAVTLIGTSSNRDGIGSVVTATFGGREHRRWVGAGGVIHEFSSFGAHFGLGEERFADLRIEWPDGKVQTLSGVESNQVLTVVEP